MKTEARPKPKGAERALMLFADCLPVNTTLDQRAPGILSELSRRAFELTQPEALDAYVQLDMQYTFDRSIWDVLIINALRDRLLEEGFMFYRKEAPHYRGNTLRLSTASKKKKKK